MLGRTEPMQCHQDISKSKLQFSLALRSFFDVRKLSRKRDASCEMPARFDHRGSFGGLPARLKEIVDRSRRQSGPLAVMGKDYCLRRMRLRVGLHGLSDSGMKSGAAAAQKTVIGGLLNQRMFERIDCV